MTLRGPSNVTNLQGQYLPIGSCPCCTPGYIIRCPPRPTGLGRLDVNDPRGVTFSSKDLPLDKEQIREQARLRRRELAKTAGRGFGSKLVETFFENFNVSSHDSVAGYWPITREANVTPLITALHEKECTCLLPVVVARDTALVFRQWQPGDALASSELDIPEPSADKPEAVPNIILVPLLAFDAEGNRLGYGGGYYDRTLSDLRRVRDITAIGIAYAGQEVDSVPNESFDQRLDWVITEAGATSFGANG